ncbi:TetR/AcrR family transcriptional regulator [Gordonibacter sp. 28C]|uniref:TetR/AcrR family transcriptional regulator n=1 Tax=Gordonibacter sp. 28C TaxID=2078569 RepID=UPI001F5472BA|nr:TetR/AcrR family transcriptional regulator [Gordonibacter sp. 28C]
MGKKKAGAGSAARAARAESPTGRARDDETASRAERAGKPSKRGGKADATRKLLLEAALGVIGEKGYSAATVDEIVEAAGVSKGVAYYHFKSKAAMAESILEEGINELIEDFEAIAAKASNAPEALTGMIERFATRIFENKAFGRFFVSELWREGRAWSDAMRGFEDRLLHLLEGQLKRGQDEGFIRLEIDPAFEAVALVGLVLTTALYYLGGSMSGALADGARGVAGGPVADGARGTTEGSGPAGSPANASGAHGDGEPCSVAEAFSHADQQRAKDAFIERICDFVRHANARPGLLP